MQIIKSNNFIWLASKYLICLILNSGKFLIAARILGPEQVGYAALSVLVISIVESISDTGLLQAVIQHERKINSSEAGLIWITQFLRGLILSALIILVSFPISIAFEVPEGLSLILLGALVPILRNSVNPGVFLIQRDSNFRSQSIYEVSALLIDVLITFILIFLDFGAISLVIGLIFNEFFKLIFSWTYFRVDLKFSMNFYEIRHLAVFGKWVWGAGFLTTLLNQLDKFIVLKLLGVSEFGFYQMASRISQLVVADFPSLFGIYLYPTFSSKHRLSKKIAYDYFKERLIFIGYFSILSSVFLIFIGPWIVMFILGDKWLSIIPLMRLLSITMFIGALISILVPYLRSVGLPALVAKATTLQFISLCLIVMPLMHYFSIYGLVVSNFIAGLVAFSFMMIQVNKISNTI